MTPDQLESARALVGMNKAQFCRAIGIVRNSYQAYARGRREVPLTVALAVAAVMRGLKPWPE